MTDVVVIGAGISGLATARELAARGCNVSVLERQVRVGGNAISERFDGYLMEHGPTTLNASVPNAMERIKSLGLINSAKPLGDGVQKRYLQNSGTLHGISTHRLGLLTSPYLSPRARIRFLTELLRRKGQGEDTESVHAFVSRRFGGEFADKVIEPMAAGIFMGDASELSISGAFPKLVEMEQRFGSITRAVLAAKRGGEPGRQLFSWPGGIATLPRTISVGLGPRVYTSVAVTRILRHRNRFEVQTANNGNHHADAVVLAVQPHVAASLLEELDPDGTSALADIAAPPVSVVFLGYRRDQVDHPLDGLGYLTTKGPDQVISGVQFNSTMFEGRAPDGHVSLSAYVGGARNPDLAKMEQKDLFSEVHKELGTMLGIKGKPVTSRLRMWARGLPQYTIGHQKRREIIQASNRRIAGLYLTGNYLGGVSVSNCLETAHSTADALHREIALNVPHQYKSATKV